MANLQPPEEDLLVAVEVLWIYRDQLPRMAPRIGVHARHLEAQNGAILPFQNHAKRRTELETTCLPREGYWRSLFQDLWNLKRQRQRLCSDRQRPRNLVQNLSAEEFVGSDCVPIGEEGFNKYNLHSDRNN
ncbi:hypothetical protein U1Q18_030356 [Sarracenia purpurea var. burkii]